MHNDKDIAPIEIDLTAGKNGRVNEIWLQMFGTAVKQIMRTMFGGGGIPVSIKGSKSEISAFAKTLARDKKYVKSAAKHGLTDPRVLKDKYKLRKAAAQFKRETGIDYPLGK